MTLHRPLVLLTLPCLLLACCQGKRQSNSKTETRDQPLADTVVDSPDLGAANEPTGFTRPYQQLLAKVNAQCPQHYPEIVTPLPEQHEFQEMSSAELLGMLESWNPVLRMEAAKALGGRGTAVVAELRQGTRSENGRVRAGSATALAAICKGVSSEQLPTDLATDFIRLSTDGEHEVRVAALDALSTLNPKTRETTLAVLAMCTDPNEYLAQDAKVALNKFFQAHTLPLEDMEAGLKAAMGGPLPNGKGHIVQVIGRLPPADQRRFIPELLEHVAWFPDRDTMFAGGGQEPAIRMLTAFKETRVVPLLPKAMGKIERGDGLFTVCLEALRAFGADAQVALPELKTIADEIEAKGQNAAIRPNRDLDAGLKQLEQTIQHLESL